MADPALIRALWTWFVANANRWSEQRIEDAAAELESKLFAIVNVGWEIGPLGDGAFFALSPDPADATKMALAEEILASAPQMPGWRFTLYKPRREWMLQFAIRAGSSYEIDGTCWEYVIYRFEDGTYDILFKPDAGVLALGDDDLHHAAMIIVDGELGEAKRRSCVVTIEVRREWNEREQRAAKLLELGALDRHIVERRQRN